MNALDRADALLKKIEDIQADPNHLGHSEDEIVTMCDGLVKLLERAIEERAKQRRWRTRTDFSKF